MRRDQISATGIVINSSPIRGRKLPSSLLVCIRDCPPDWHAPQIGAGIWVPPSSSSSCVGRSSSPEIQRRSSRKICGVARLVPIALLAYSPLGNALHQAQCTAHSTKVPHFLIRRPRSDRPQRPSRLRAIFGCFPRPFSASVYARASSSLWCMFGIQGMFKSTYLNENGDF